MHWRAYNAHMSSFSLLNFMKDKNKDETSNAKKAAFSLEDKDIEKLKRDLDKMFAKLSKRSVNNK